jgi:8-oxo-dGTP pyrophosphatase MutT (NUDIX family)
MCVTGYLPPGTDPLVHACTEIFEETGIRLNTLQLIHSAPSLTLKDHRRDQWSIWAYLFEVSSTRVQLNWENDDVVWLHRTDALPRQTTYWLPHVLQTLTPTRGLL